MSVNYEAPDIRALVWWLGPQGAIAGLSESKIWPLDRLRGVSQELSIKVSEKTTRSELIKEIVRVANKRIAKPIEELYAMSVEELTSYLQSVQPDSEELIDLLKDLNLSPRKEGRQNLIEFAARELSETGRFMRIATKREDLL